MVLSRCALVVRLMSIEIFYINYQRILSSDYLEYKSVYPTFLVYLPCIDSRRQNFIHRENKLCTIGDNSSIQIEPQAISNKIIICNNNSQSERPEYHIGAYLTRTIIHCTSTRRNTSKDESSHNKYNRNAWSQ